MSLNIYPSKKDYCFFLGFNKNGRLQIRIATRILELVPIIRVFMTRVLAQLIHNSGIFGGIADPDTRRDEEWYASERLLLAEYGTDFVNATVKCLLAKACFVVAGMNPELPSIEGVLKRVEDGKIVVGRNFGYYLEDLAKNEVNAWRVLREVADERIVSISFEDAQGSLEEELEELFDRRRDEIDIPQ